MGGAANPPGTSGDTSFLIVTEALKKASERDNLQVGRDWWVPSRGATATTAAATAEKKGKEMPIMTTTAGEEARGEGDKKKRRKKRE